MEYIKNLWGKILAFLARFSKKTLIIASIGLGAVVIASVVIAVILNTTDYEVLFTGMTDEESGQVVAILQEDGVDYSYRENGDILVDSSVVDQVRANLVLEGYPKSGFGYGIYTQYAGGMTTDTEKQQYELYDLQDRIGATVRLFDGVSDAKVTITVADADKYVLTDDAAEQNQATASVTVVMEPDKELSPEQASAIQRLVAFGGVPGLLMENVRVFDAMTGLEISPLPEDEEAEDEALVDEAIKIIEEDMRQKVIEVVGPFYGEHNVRVSVNGKINLDEVVRESISYTTPDKIDEEDKTGIVDQEDTNIQVTYPADTNVDITGTETNAEATQYNGGVEDGGTVVDESIIRDYLVNQVIEQTEIGKGALEDLTVSVSINSEDYGGVESDELLDLIGNATGIDAELREDKITVVAAPFYEEEEEPVEEAEPSTLIEYIGQNPLPFIIGGAVLLLIIILIIVLLVLRSKKRKREEAERLEAELIAEAETQVVEAISIQDDQAHEIRETLRTFAEDNPDIFAQILKSWVGGGEVDGK